MTKSATTEDSWRVWVLNALLQMHRDHPGKSLVAARAVVAEGAKFISEYHGKDVAVGQLDIIGTTILSDSPLPDLPAMLKFAKEPPARWWHALYTPTFVAGWTLGWICFGVMLLAGRAAALW